MHIQYISRSCALMAALVAGLSVPVAAQEVGYPPERSPFRDIDYRQELTPFAGYFWAGKDVAGVAPRSAPTFGIRYEANVGGPVGLLVRVSTVRSERLVVDPTAPVATRELGIQDWPLYVADFGVAVNLTGQRTYHRLVPLLNLGFGFASDANRAVDEDPFNLGTSFALVYGLGVRMVPGGRFQVRFGLDNYMYRLEYPASYYTAPSEDESAVAPEGQKRNFWKNNMALTLGGSLLFFR